MLHILTACTRPTNLPKIAESLSLWGPDADFIWHIRFDLLHRYVGGQAVKNAMLEELEVEVASFVMFLDDDTVVHPDLYARFREHWEHGAIVVSQEHSVFGVLRAAPENVKVNSIDVGQAIIRRDVIGAHRIPETYAGDGEFLSAILPHVDAVYLDEVLSFHNALG